ncbi:hemolysin family protein [Candidatus Protochlamydia phocaeensis]|uniref:hemolysin family protein n=1 Tax=Candidatus Protochlamydia phocaeensis TaxID=1414722 RepID=UPI000839397D|nr:hemolysin family protein [Candidatus Protochlamydia phocaeensis]
MLDIAIIILCVLMNAILANAETAFIAVSIPALRELTKRGNERAKLLLFLRERPERTLSVIQIGITFVAALAAAIGGSGAEEFLTPWIMSSFAVGETLARILSLLIVVIPLTYASVVIGELVPKTFALRRPLFFASVSAPWLHFISRLLNPFVTIFEWSTKKIIHFIPKKHGKEEPFLESSLIELDILSAPNRQYVLNIVKIETTVVKEIMVSWPEVTYVEENHPLELVENIIISSGHTRLPVIKNNEVMGIINAKEFLAFQKTGQLNWLSLIHAPLKISDQTPLLTALRTMQEKRAHMAIVYAGNNKIGIVTMEAIFEEIIGDIYDEEDENRLRQILSAIQFKKSSS